MFGRLLLAAALIAGGVCIQQNVRRQRARRREKQIDIPRWEDEGGPSQPAGGNIDASQNGS